MIQTFRSNGKVLLSAEYFVIDGALALALPTKLGQELRVKITENAQSTISWKSFNSENKVWFECEISTQNLQIISTSNQQFVDRLLSILKLIANQNPAIFSLQNSYYFETYLEFPNEFGLGSSSTLLNNLAKFSNTSPYYLLENTFGGSGYDVACAEANQPILYSIENNIPNVQIINLSENITQELAFVFLNKKQNSREGIALYKSKPKDTILVNEISNITIEIAKSTNIKEFELLVNQHENIVSKFLQLPKVKEVYFSDYKGSVKSLGAWGGDFVAITKTDNYNEYFESKGFSVMYDYNKLIL